MLPLISLIPLIPLICLISLSQKDIGETVPTTIEENEALSISA